MDSASKLSLRFLGGAGTVTGSKYLVSFKGRRILVDCGLFQGLKELRIKNWDRFPIDPREIEAIVLTHAHIDHSGYIPRLVKEGFRGKIYCTPATHEMARLLLLDTAFLQEEEAEYFNRKRITKHAPALPLFTQKDVERTLENFAARDFGQEFEIFEGLKVCLHQAGHILGAAFVTLKAGGVTIGFSGDVGRPHDEVMRPPQKLPPVDYLLLESTYGDRRHPDTSPATELEAIVNATYARRGVVMIPAFAVGRAQTLMHILARSRKAGRIPRDLPMYLNSPLAHQATQLYYEFKELHRLSQSDCDEMTNAFRDVASAKESRDLNEKSGPMLIVSASGMASGGRILHHLKAFAGDPNSSIVLAGFQAAGTRGRALQDGARSLRIHWQQVPVNAAVHTVENLSAHADYEEILAWLKSSQARPKRVFLVHGEPDAARSLAGHLQRELGWTSEIPPQDFEVTFV